jgi:hypothetical protein
MGLDFKNAEFLLSEAERKVSFQRQLLRAIESMVGQPGGLSVIAIGEKP